ncbi:MAG: HEPN domain-containing protein [Chloroflexi bacterium]|nr:HEPN domain-containing protein [Chloroflexota bacterium]MCY3696687.1 HEPN domain-containing protein [Chloroflexota bacterium]
MAQSKPMPYEAFADNIRDAETLLHYAIAFQNERTRAMRSELRKRIGEALRVPPSQREQLDCIQSRDVFVVFLPDGELNKENFFDLRPLLRQSLVAACAALETYVADKALEFVGPALRADELPPRMKGIQLTIGHWVDIEREYSRRGWGIRGIVEEHIRETSSTDPSQIGKVLSAVGVKDWLKRVDRHRKAKAGTTAAELTELTSRRNRIAHFADRQGRGRAALTAEEVGRYLTTVKAVVEATEDLLRDHYL